MYVLFCMCYAWITIATTVINYTINYACQYMHCNYRDTFRDGDSDSTCVVQGHLRNNERPKIDRTSQPSVNVRVNAKDC